MYILFELLFLVCYICGCNIGCSTDRTWFGWFGLFWFVIFVVVMLVVLLIELSLVGLVCFGLVSILIYYNEFDEDKAGYLFRDWFAMSRNMTSLLRL